MYVTSCAAANTETPPHPRTTPTLARARQDMRVKSTPTTLIVFVDNKHHLPTRAVLTMRVHRLTPKGCVCHSITRMDTSPSGCAKVNDGTYTFGNGGNQWVVWL